MSTLINLATVGAVKHAMFVRLSIPDPNASPPGSTNTVYRISNYETNYSITESDNIAYEYQAAGILLGVSQFQNELRPSNNDVNVSLSGIPNTAISQALQYPIKGSEIEIRRAFFDPETNALLNVGGQDQVALRYKGVVNNYSYDESWNDVTDTVSFTVTLSCTSIVSVLANKVNGRLTNNHSFKYWSGLPTARGGFNNSNANLDVSMDRVAIISTTFWDFGKPTKTSIDPGRGGGGGGGGGRGFEERENVNEN